MPVSEKKEKQDPFEIQWLNESPISEDEYLQLKNRYRDYLECTDQKKDPFKELPRLIIQTMLILNNKFSLLDLSFNTIFNKILKLSIQNEKTINALHYSYLSSLENFSRSYTNFNNFKERYSSFFELIKSSKKLKSHYRNLLKKVNNTKKIKSNFIWLMRYRRNIIAYYNDFKLSSLINNKTFESEKVMRHRLNYIRGFIQFLRGGKGSSAIIPEGILLRAACLYIIDQCLKFKGHKDDSVDQLCLSAIELLSVLQERMNDKDSQVPAEIIAFFNPNCKNGHVKKISNEDMERWKKIIEKRIASRAQEEERQKLLLKKASEKAEKIRQELIEEEEKKDSVLKAQERVRLLRTAEQCKSTAKYLGESDDINAQCPVEETAKKACVNACEGSHKEKENSECQNKVLLEQPACLSDLEEAIRSLGLFLGSLSQQPKTAECIVKQIRACIDRRNRCDQFAKNNQEDDFFKPALDHVMSTGWLKSEEPLTAKIASFSELDKKRSLFWYQKLCHHGEDQHLLTINNFFGPKKNYSGKESDGYVCRQSTAILNVIKMITFVADLYDKKSYVHGGFVRDIFQGKQFNDVDMVTSLSVIQLNTFFKLMALKGGVSTKVINAVTVFSFSVDGVDFDVTCKKNVVSINELYQSEDFYFNALYLQWCERSGFMLHDPSGEGVFYAKASCARLIPNSFTRADPFLFIRIIRFYCVKGYWYENDQIEKIKGSACVNAFIKLSDDAERDPNAYTRIILILSYIQRDIKAAKNHLSFSRFLDQLIPRDKRKSPLVEQLYSAIGSVKVNSSLNCARPLFSNRDSGNMPCSSRVLQELSFSIP